MPYGRVLSLTNENIVLDYKSTSIKMQRFLSVMLFFFNSCYYEAFIFIVTSEVKFAAYITIKWPARIVRAAGACDSDLRGPRPARAHPALLGDLHAGPANIGK